MPADSSFEARLRGRIVDVDGFPTPGVVFRDITAVLADADLLRETVHAMATPFEKAGVQLVAGIESRGFILGGAIAAALAAGFVPIRKQGKLPRAVVSTEYHLEYGTAVLEVHADSLTAGQRVLIVDDVLATGGTAAAALTLVRRLGGDPVGLSFLVEIGGLGGAAAVGDVRHTALVRY